MRVTVGGDIDPAEPFLRALPYRLRLSAFPSHQALDYGGDIYGS